MGRKYDLVFKERALKYLNTIRRGGSLNLKGERINTVRKLTAHLGISNDSLYNWDKQLKVREAIEEKFQEEEKEEEEKESYEIITAKTESLTFPSEIRFFGALASALGIKGYPNMTKNDLQLKIGLALIKRSGLVQTDTLKILNGDK